jgi:hypothetical protein
MIELLMIPAYRASIISVDLRTLRQFLIQVLPLRSAPVVSGPPLRGWPGNTDIGKNRRTSALDGMQRVRKARQNRGSAAA